MDNIWGVLILMIHNYEVGIRKEYVVIYVYSKYTWDVSLKDKKVESFTNIQKYCKRINFLTNNMGR